MTHITTDPAIIVAFQRLMRRLTTIEEIVTDIAADVMILRDVVEDL